MALAVTCRAWPAALRLGGAALQSAASLATWSQQRDALGEQLCEPSTSGRAGGSAAGLLLLDAPHHVRRIFNFAGQADVAKRYSEKKLLGYSPRQMYDVVSAVEHYHEFVPWCQRSTVTLRRPPSYLEAELEVGFQMFVERYTSKVTMHCPTLVRSSVEDSTLFSHLSNQWEFRPGPSPHTTWLAFDVDFAFKSPLYRHIASVFFEEVVQRMMGAFEGRCARLYGPSSLHRRAAGPAAAGHQQY